MKKTKQGLLIEGKQSVLKLSVLSESIIRGSEADGQSKCTGRTDPDKPSAGI